MGELLGDLVRLGFLFTLWGLAIWIGGASVAAWVAWEKGREPVAWFVVAFFLSPLVGLVALSAVPALHHGDRRRPVRPAVPDRQPIESPVGAAASLAPEGVSRKENRWDVVTSAATTTKRPW